MRKQTLLTSFATWMPHQRSNSSDDLLGRIEETGRRSFHFLRRLPVDFQLAPKLVIAKLDELQPDVLICCGMAEERDKLSLESTASVGDEQIKTDLPIDKLIAGLAATQISHDAGRFVCNHLYFEVLRHVREQERAPHFLFIHVPVLNDENATMITDDFLEITERLSAI